MTEPPASNLPWFPFYADRFLGSRKVRLMTTEEVGVYVFLMCEQWANPIPDDDRTLASIGRADIATVRSVLALCFTLTENGWVNERLAEHHTEAQMRLDILSNAGKAGAEARWGKGQDGKRKRPQSDRNARKENNTLQNKLLFETFWITARKKIGKLDAERAFLKALKRKDAGDLMAVWESYNAGVGSDLKYVPNPATWLNQGRWLDEATTQASGETGRARPLKSGGFYVGN